jgi:hypothetical protein
MAVEKPVRQVLTANLLKDGLVVFMTDGSAWSPWIEDSAIATTKAAALELEAKGNLAAKSNLVVGPYLIDVIDDKGRIRASHIREHLRTLGPTVRPDLGKQAERAAGGSGQGGAFI